jgi:hypothetical protein
MTNGEKYGYCISFGIAAVVGIPLALFLIAFGLFYLHINVSLNLMVVIAFPYLFLADWQPAFPIVFIAVFGSLLQWPLYGWILGSGWVHHRFLKYATVLACIHAIVTIIALCYCSKHPDTFFKGSSAC